MRRSTCTVLLVGFLFLTFASCEKTPDFLQNPSPEKGGATLQKNENAHGKPDREAPAIVSLWVESPTTVLPGGGNPVVVHYKVSDNVNVEKITVKFIYDNNDDEYYHIFCSNVYKREIRFSDTKTIREDTLQWNGHVSEQYSSDGYLFDQYATKNPDTYLLYFEVSDGSGNSVHNWMSTDQDLVVKVDPDSEKALVNPGRTVPEFHVTSVIADWKEPSKKKGRYAGELLASVTCSEGGFSGKGQWLQVYFDENGNIDHEGPIQDRDGCPNWSFRDDDGDGAAEMTSSDLYVGPGTYRFHVKNVYRQDYSYDPWTHDQWPWPDVEPFAEVTVPE